MFARDEQRHVGLEVCRRQATYASRVAYHVKRRMLRYVSCSVTPCHISPGASPSRLAGPQDQLVSHLRLPAASAAELRVHRQTKTLEILQIVVIEPDEVHRALPKTDEAALDRK